MTGPLHLTLEFSRRDSADQPQEFRFAPQVYHLRNPGGDVDAAEFPWTAELLADLVALREKQPDPAAAFRVGAVLQRFLERTAWAAHEPAIVEASRVGAPITITIRSAAAELYGLPWELMTLRGANLMLGGIPGLVVRYEWPGTTSARDSVPAGARRGRVLFAWSAAGGAVPAAEHLEALAEHVRGFDRARDVIPHASFAAIAEALARASGSGPPVDTLHLLCHGAATGATYGLALDGADGRVIVDAGRMQQLLAPHVGALDTVVLAACDSGNTGEPGNFLGSIAQMIHRAGLRHVIASRFPLSAAGSTRFAEAFYAAHSNHPIGPAFVAARDALVRDPSQFDWASIQLYARAADVAAIPPAAPVRRPYALIAGAVAGLVAAAAILVPPLLAGPADPPIVDPVKSSDPPPVAPVKTAEPSSPPTTPIAPPAEPTKTADPPTVTKSVDIAMPSGTSKRKPPGGCPAAKDACDGGIEATVLGNLLSQPRMLVTIDCAGAITYTLRGPDPEGAAGRRDKLKKISTGAGKLPCKIDAAAQ